MDAQVTIVMSIGFCVDFAAHLAYNFAKVPSFPNGLEMSVIVKGDGVSTDLRMRNALYAVGTPILQSASSTILGVSFLASTESYVFRSFLKVRVSLLEESFIPSQTIILVITLGALHGLVILPVLLTLFHCRSPEEEEEEEKEVPLPFLSLSLQYPLQSSHRDPIYSTSGYPIKIVHTSSDYR